MSTQAASGREALTALDWIGVVAAAGAALALVSFPVVGRSFAAMFRDFGSREPLPVLTRLAISGWCPVLVGLLAAGAVLAGASSRLPLRARRACIVGGFVLGCAGLALCVAGVYLPIFAIAGAVKAD